jgi:hypothetical protein
MATLPSYSQRAKLAEETRKRFVADASRAMVEIAGAAEDRLTTLLNEAAPSREMQTRRDAWTLYQRTRVAWLDGTIALWQQALLPQPVSVKAAFELDGLQLIGTDVVENKILTSRLVMSVSEKVVAELDDLRVRIKLLEESEDFASHDILRPDVVIKLLIEQWSTAGMPRESWPLISDAVQRQLSEKLKAAYGKCNEFLIKQGVLPNIEMKDRVKQRMPSFNSRGAGGGRRPEAGADGGPPGGAGDPGPSGYGDVGGYGGGSQGGAGSGGYQGGSNQGGYQGGGNRAGSGGYQGGGGHQSPGGDGGYNPGSEGGGQGGYGGSQSGGQGGNQGRGQSDQGGYGGGQPGGNAGANYAEGQPPARGGGAFGGRLGWGGEPGGSPGGNAGANDGAGSQGGGQRGAPGGQGRPSGPGSQSGSVGGQGPSGRSSAWGNNSGDQAASFGPGGLTTYAPPGNMMGQRPTEQVPAGQPRGPGPQVPGLGPDGRIQRPDSPYVQAFEETRMLTSTTPLARARSRALGVVGQLKRLLVGRAGSDDGSSSGPQSLRASPGLAAALAVRPPRGQDVYQGGGTVFEEYTPAGVARVANRLREQTTELKKKAETKSEKATIEIVALMFQAILQEDRIPPGIRVWFARLQMPVLRVALEEPDFFGTLDHPARQLIDRMGSCVMGFDASGVQGGSLEGEIKRVVQVIEQYPETGKRVYQLVYEEFQKFLAKFLTEKSSTQRVVSVAQQVEQKETLTIQYTIEMRNMLKDMPVREEIREFLFKVWADVLAVAAVRKGPQHAETLELKKSATDLVWAASAKPNRNDRARVIADLPKLLQRLRTGMTLLGVPTATQEIHVKTVSDTLADAFMSKTQAIPQAQIEAMAKRLANLEDFVSEDGMGDLPLDADSIEIMLGIDASTIDVVADGGSKPTAAMLAWGQELQLGSWFTLDHNGRVTQVQFAWRSERKHLNLFASIAGHSFLIQAGRLAAYLQAGLLLPQEEETLTVRATRDALAKLEANPQRLLA